MRGLCHDDRAGRQRRSALPAHAAETRREDRGARDLDEADEDERDDEHGVHVIDGERLALLDRPQVRADERAVIGGGEGLDVGDHRLVALHVEHDVTDHVHIVRRGRGRSRGLPFGSREERAGREHERAVGPREAAKLEDRDRGRDLAGSVAGAGDQPVERLRTVAQR